VLDAGHVGAQALQGTQQDFLLLCGDAVEQPHLVGLVRLLEVGGGSFAGGGQTGQGCRSACATFSASHTASFVASAVVQVRKPRCVRICWRWYSIVEPDHS
jgi:hypothetical protein